MRVSAEVVIRIAYEIWQVIHGMSVVALNRMISSEMDSVVLRNRDAARTATEHLLQHGYRKIACVVSRPEITSFQQRWEGYNDALGAKRLPTRLIEAPNHDQLRYALCSVLLGRHRPDALLCFSNRATQTVPSYVSYSQSQNHLLEPVHA